jgi:hypothetical protein
VVPVDDALAETTETLTAWLSPSPFYTSAPGASATVSIMDNDAGPSVSVIASGPNASKQGLAPGRFTVLRTGNPASALTVNLSISGTATNGLDYSTISNTVTFAAGAGSAEILVQPLPGSGLEPPKTIVLTLVSGADYNLVSPAFATVTLSQPGPGFGVLREWFNGIGYDGTVQALTNHSSFPNSPSGSAYVRDLFEGPLDTDDQYGSRFRGWFIAPMTGNYVFFIASDDASQLWLGTDAQASTRRVICHVPGWTTYRNWTAQSSQRSAAIPLVARQRYYIEALQAEGAGGDHCSVGVQLPNGALDRPISGQWLEPWSAKGRLLAVFASDASASETGDPGEFILRRTGDASASLSVSVGLSGTATSGTDFNTISTLHTFPAGVSEIRIPVVPRGDTFVEGPETITLTLAANNAYDLGLSDSATVNLISDPPTANLAVLDTTASEGPAETASFRVLLSSAVFGPVTFNYGLSGTASNGLDYVLPGFVTLQPGQTFTNIILTALMDSEFEPAETVNIALSKGAGYTIGTANSISLTIENTLPPNTAPTLNSVGDQVLLAGQTLQITNRANDTDVPAQTLTFSLLAPPTGAGVHPSLGVLSWRPAITQSPGIYQMVVKVQDDGSPSLSATQFFQVTVNQPATPSLAQPQWSPQGFTLRLSGDVGPDYHVQASTNLVDWTTLSMTNPPALPIDWLDPDAATAPLRFYRVLLGP